MVLTSKRVLAAFLCFFCSYLRAEPTALPIQEVPALKDTVRDESGADALIQAALNEVRTIARRSKKLETFGKESMSPSVTLMDLAPRSVPPLAQTLKNHKENWMVRYWACDLLGYVGTAQNMGLLLGVARNEREPKLLRLRALDSLAEITNRHDWPEPLRLKLVQLSRKSPQKTIRIKAQSLRKKIDLARNARSGLSPTP